MQDERLNQILCHYGIGAQTMKTIEELSELIQALVKKDKDNIREEIADCFIMLNQMCLVYGSVDDIIESKIQRTLQRTGGE